MENKNAKPLLIYSASAGSGKTFSLVQHYLKLTLGKNKPPMNFGKILAMTFTNKAAWEMKERIIQGLDFLANFEKLTANEQKKATQILVETQKNTSLPAEQIQKNAHRTLSEILHHYEEYNILTIDKFSLRLIRTFSRDLDLMENFEVVMDQDILLEQVIDELMSKIGKSDEQEITQLTLNYAKSNLAEGDSWNFRNSLINFGKILTKEADYVYAEKLLEKEYTATTYQEIIKELKVIEQQHSDKKNAVYHYFVSLNSTADDYPNKSRGVFKTLTELPSRNLLTAKTPSNQILSTISGANVKPEHNVDEQLMSDLDNLFLLEHELFPKAFTLSQLKSNFYNLALLKYIARELNTFKEQKNLIGIFEFGQKIAQLLKKENAPYIYERLGNRYNHYLLDEFQDTSRLQWINLIPLIQESISHGYANLIVGDPKQAIYRFRNGLVEQFVALPEIYNPEKDSELAQISQYFKLMGEKKPLQTNFRSKKNIIAFNNAFFTELLQLLPENLNKYYEDIIQIPASKEGGFVSIEKTEKDLDKVETENAEEQFLLEKIEKCKADGYAYGDICILTRNKREGNRFARFLTQKEYKKGHKYKVVSTDSLLVSSNLEVGFFIDYLNLRRNAGNKTFRIKFASSFYQVKGIDPIVALQDFWIEEKVGNLHFTDFVAKEFGDWENLFFLYENLYDLGAKFFRLLKLNELKNPYLHHLMELLQAYDLKNGPDIRGFIEEWESKLSTSSILVPENKEAIKIMTVHKSKGLEFRVVILPDLSWKINPSRNKQFIETEENQILYWQLKRENIPHFFREKYEEEYEKLLLDEINTLYVACTRPAERLYILLKNDFPKNPPEYYSKINHLFLRLTENWNHEIMTSKTENQILIGEENSVEEHKETDEKNNFYPKDLQDFLWFPELVFQDKEALENETLDSKIKFGNLLHAVLANCNKETEIENILSTFFAEGKIEKNQIPELEKMAQKVIQFLKKQPFVQEAEEILSEQDLLISESETKRPDKIYLNGKTAVVVDFKTGERSQKHTLQVIQYCKYLQEIGLENVKGFLLYTANLELIPITNPD